MAGAGYTDARTTGNPTGRRHAKGAHLPRFAAAATLARPAGGGKAEEGRNVDSVRRRAPRGVVTAEAAARRRRVLEVRDVRTRFRTRNGTVYAVNGVGFDLHEGETLGVVGESGSGKSVTMMSLLGLLPTPPAEIVSGRAMLDGEDLISLDAARLRRVRGAKVGFVFQDPMTSLNPVLTVGRQIAEPLRTHLGLGARAARRRAVELLEQVGIPAAESRLGDFPHRLSGGMRQRVMIAVAVACDPKVLIADEPTTALDVTVQAQILDLAKRLRRRRGMAIVWITHDLGVVAGLADRAMVMYAGLAVERAGVRSLYARPRHPYTRALLRTRPRLDGARPGRLASIGGQPPVLAAPPESCPFAPRCAHAFARCWRENPPLRPVADGHEAACWFDVEAGVPRDA